MHPQKVNKLVKCLFVVVISFDFIVVEVLHFAKDYAAVGKIVL
jgi:hypothetical protein